MRFERDRPGQNRRVSIIVKTNDDVRQEQLAMELLKHMIDCFEEAGQDHLTYFCPHVAVRRWINL